MEEILNQIVNFVSSSGIYGSLISCGLILIESILPILPLMVFISINFVIWGNVIGFIISWIFTILGCIISYMIFKYGFGNKFERLTEDKEKLKKYKHTLKNISFINLTILIAIPFTPAFMVNIAAGLVKMDFKKYLLAIIIGKISLVYFWGFIGTSFIDSINNPEVLIKIGILLVCTYILSIIVNKVLKIK